MKYRLLFIGTFLLTFLLPHDASSQFGVGFTYGGDFYQRYTYEADGIADPSSGSAVLNISVGPKIWVGGNDVSLSLEGQVNWGILGLDTKDYKGLGHLSFPLIANINFGSLTGLTRKDGIGYMLGGGLQYNRTEAYGLDEEYAILGVQRDYFRTYIVQLGVGYGVSGFGTVFFARYGFDPDSSANSLNIGTQIDMNLVQMRKIDDPASRL